jgi:hypothetical protein
MIPVFGGTQFSRLHIFQNPEFEIEGGSSSSFTRCRDREISPSACNLPRIELALCKEVYPSCRYLSGWDFENLRMIITHVCPFSEIREGHYITHISRLISIIRRPDFQPGDVKVLI